MRHISFGRHRGADWLGRVAFPLEAAHAAHERFVLRLHDPRHPRAIWACLTLERDGNRAGARCSVAYFDGNAKVVRLAEESWPLERAAIDPERSGLGVGECALSVGHGHALVHGDGFALALDVELAPTEPPQSLLSADWLYSHRRLTQKASVPVPHATVRKGGVELWHELGRDAPRTRLDAAGWHASLTHTWGEGLVPGYAAAHAHAVEGAPVGAYLHAVANPGRLLRLVDVQPQLGVLQLGPGPTTFTGWRALRHAAPAQVDDTGWRMELQGGGQAFVGEVRAAQSLCVDVTGPFGRPMRVSELAELTATFTPRGELARTVRVPRASLELLR